MGAKLEDLSIMLRESAEEYRRDRASPGPAERIVIRKPKGPIADIQAAALIEAEPIRWLWRGWLARGKIHILAGSPGTGKTTIALKLAAAVSTGGELPDGTRAEQGNVVMWSGEDGISDTLVPRLIAAGADRERVYFVTGVTDGLNQRAFDPARDVQALYDAIQGIGGAALIVVDPIVNAVAGDSHKNAETRRGLQPLADLAEMFDAALLGITHLTKGTAGRDPVERVTGSLAFGAVARIVMMAARKQTEDDADARVFCRAKSNIGRDGGGFAYSVRPVIIEHGGGIETSTVDWGEPLEGSAREIMADDDAPAETKAEDAETFLKSLLGYGPAAADEVKKEAQAHKIAWRTIERAKKALGVRSRKAAGGWEWSIPGGAK